MELQELPQHLLALGGYVGLEFGQMFRRFGSTVTIVQHGLQLLGREDSDVAAEVLKLLQADGIEVLLETEAVGVHATASGVGVELRGPAGVSTVTGSHLLLAVGRLPKTRRLRILRRWAPSVVRSGWGGSSIIIATPHEYRTKWAWHDIVPGRRVDRATLIV